MQEQFGEEITRIFLYDLAKTIGRADAKNCGLLQVGMMTAVWIDVLSHDRLNRLAFRISSAGPEGFSGVFTVLGHSLYHVRRAVRTDLSTSAQCFGRRSIESCLGG